MMQLILSQQQAITKIGCDPSWDTFSCSFGWWRLRQQMSPSEQDYFKERWLQAYYKKKEARHYAKGRMPGT